MPIQSSHRSKKSVLCLVTDAYGGTGGIALYNRDIIAAMCADDSIARVVVVARVAPNAKEPLPEKVFFDERGLGGGVAYLRAVMRHASARGSFDLVYCAHINLIPIARLAAAFLGVPWVLCLYGVEAWTPSPRVLSRLWARHADRVFSLGTVTQDRFLSWCRYDAARCVKLPNALRLDAFGMAEKDPQLLDRYGLRHRKVVMTLGRLDPTERAKGFDRMIELLPAIAQQIPNVAYMIVGSGGDRARLQALAESNGVADRVVFAGFVSEADKPAHYNLADAYIMPSTLEGFGFVYTEAMACGLPVVGSSIDGSREALRDGMLGELVDPFNREALLAASLAALAKPKAIPEGLSYFSFENFSARLQAALRSLLHSDPAR